MAVAGAIVASFYYRSLDVAGPGDVEVWISEPASDIGTGRMAGTASTSRPGFSESFSPTTDTGVLEAATTTSSEDAGSAGARGGAGGAGGPGKSGGSGGNETLSSIWRKINSSKYYPSSARRGGITGVPRVAFELDENGAVKWVKVVASCGKKLLDDAAVETVRRATPLPYYPKPITVAVRYSLSR